jgi:SulP family sulfate permease
MQYLLKLLPFLSWIGNLKDTNVLKADIIAGITVALILIPQSMAYAQLAGLPTQYGLYASFLPVIVSALFGSSRQLSTGPVAIVSLLTAAALEPYASNPDTYIVYASLLALIIGIFQLILGFARMGFIINFLSHPVVLGFTNAAAMIIAVSQLPKFFGITVEKSEHTYETILNIFTSIFSYVHVETTIMAISSFAILILFTKFLPKIPAILMAVVFGTTASYFLDYGVSIADGGMGGAIIGFIQPGLPAFAIPLIITEGDGFIDTVLNFFNSASPLLGAAITISLIGFMEAISVAKSMASQTKQRLDVNQELIGQGSSNLASSLFQGYAVSGSFSRSAVNISAGAKTGFSSVIAMIMVGAALLWMTPLLFHLPQATLAAIIIMAVVGLIKTKPVFHAWKVEKHDAFVAVFTFVATIFTAPHLENGIMIGVLLSLGLFLYRTMEPKFVELRSGNITDLLLDNQDKKVAACDVVSIIKYSGSLYFANAAYFENKMISLMAKYKNCLKFIIIDMGSINQIDASGEEILRNLVVSASDNGIEILLAKCEGIKPVLENSGFIEKYGENRIFGRRSTALSYAWGELGKEHNQAESYGIFDE